MMTALLIWMALVILVFVLLWTRVQHLPAEPVWKQLARWVLARLFGLLAVLGALLVYPIHHVLAP